MMQRAEAHRADTPYSPIPGTGMYVDFSEYGWLALGAWSLACLIGAWRWIERPRQQRGGAPGPWCGRCGYSLHARAPLPETCPECGAVVADTVAIRQPNGDWHHGLRMFAWTLAGLTVTAVAVFLTPAAVSLGTDHHIRQLRMQEEYDPSQPNLTLFDEIIVFQSGYRWVWLDDVSGPRRPGRLRVILDARLTLPDSPRAEMEVQPFTLAYQYITASGNSIADPRALDDFAFLAWLAQAGLNTRDARLQHEAALALSYIRGVAMAGPYPELRDDGPLIWSSHVPIGSWRPFYPIWLPVLVLIVCQVMWLWTADRRITRIRASPAPTAKGLGP
jgi:hypothetical protein